MKQRIYRFTGPAALALMFAGSAAVAAAIEPPPEPGVKPIISVVRSEDGDGDGIEDRLLSRARAAEARLRLASSEADAAAAQAELDAVVQVELVFSRQVTQPEIDAFLAAGGEITYLYRAVSYGWNGTLRLGDVERVADDLRGDLVVVVETKPLRLHLDEATQTGRVRPIWASGFAGVGAGIDGDANITIAIVDSGVDRTHPDLLSGRVGSIDWTLDGTPDVDYLQHGTQVAAIAVGTGAEHGSAAATLSWTQSGRMTASVPDEFFYPSPVHIVGSTTMTSTAVFGGGGSTDLFGASAPDDSITWGDMSTINGSSPLGPVVTGPFIGVAGTRYGPRLEQDATPVGYFAVASTLTDYPAVGDGFNTLSGVCPGCMWYSEKMFPNLGTANEADANEALDHIVSIRAASNVKVANLSFGGMADPAIFLTMRDKVNTAVANGIFVAISAGNDGAGTAGANVVDDPGRAGMAMTVGATNDVNQLTDYTSSGFTGPGASEDYKPDVLAPGGSLDLYSGILSADSNTSDGNNVASGLDDQVTDDYGNAEGSSMAAAFVAGAAGLVIDAMQQAGMSWDHDSSLHPLLVKMILSATATETNTKRESADFDPELNRNDAGTGDSLGWPARKDRYEGYGMINPDAAVEAVLLPLWVGNESDSFPGTVSGRRAWARNLALEIGVSVTCDLELDNTLDADVYLFSETPDANGNPVALFTTTTAGVGDGIPGAVVDEVIDYDPAVTETGYLVIKRVSGSGNWLLTCTSVPVELMSFSIE